MAEHPLQGMMGITMDKVREMVDSSTIIGDPIKVDQETTIIPVSRVTFGFASGGADVGAKASKEMFGGGAGAGLSITPAARFRWEIRWTLTLIRSRLTEKTSASYESANISTLCCTSPVVILQRHPMSVDAKP